MTLKKTHNKTPNEPIVSGQQSAGGAYTDISNLIALRHIAKQIPAIKVSRSHNPLSGLLTSNFKGRGIDFAEVRQYEPGDDVRTIDWRVTARTQQPHTKLFQEERERPVMILVDQSNSMFFGSKVRFKSVLAAETAAIFAWSSLHHGDRVGGMVFNDTEHREVRPRRNKHSVLRLLHEMHDFNHRLQRSNQQYSSSNLASALLNLRRIAKHGFTVVIISDFLQFDADSQSQLRQLCRHNDIVGIHISDPMEHELPTPDLYTITNGDQRVQINTALARNRNAYLQEFETRVAGVTEQFARLKAPLISIETASDVSQQLLFALDQQQGGNR